MADHTITANLQITDTGNTASKRIQDMRDLNAESDKLEANNKRRSAAARLAENTDYNAARAIGAGTGAAGRDFGKEARAVGGLVAVYAQYAATVFAVEAAFRKLKEAADVENMTKGMDQMAGQTGVALGSLSKQFVEATGYAISLKEGMEAVSKASSAGLNNQQILQVADAAKKASAALGRDLNDSISRLSRGISKLEPELLDELGIYSKLGPATEKYAAQIGKPVHALTEYQRVQAFANAVLKEANDKFGKIQVDTNPYDKLLATLNNLVQTGLTFVNGILKPIASLLAENPIALAGALALLAKSVFDKFLPAFGQLRASARDEANRLADVAKARAEDSAKSLSEAKQLAANKLKLQKDQFAQEQADAIDAAEKKLRAIDQTNLTAKAKRIISNPDIDKITDKQLDYLKDQASKKTKAGSDAYLGFVKAVEAAKQAELDYFESVRKAQLEASRAPGGTFDFTAAGMTAKEAERARQKAAGANIIANAAETANTEGFIKAMKDAKAAIGDEALSPIRKGFTYIGAAAAAAATRLAQFANAAGIVGMVVGTLVSTVQILGLFFNTAVIETEKLKKQMEQLSDASLTARSVLKNFGDEITVESLLAKSKSIESIAVAISDLPQALEMQQKAMSGWEKFWDAVLPQALGGNIKGRFSKTMAQSVIDAVNNAATPELKQQTQEKLKDILKIQGDFNLDSATSGIEKAGENTRIGVAQIIKELNRLNSEITDPLQKTKDGFKSLEKAYLDVKNSFVSTDKGTLFSLELINQLGNLNVAFDNPISKLATLRDLAKDMSKINLLPADTQTTLRSAASEMKALEEQLAKAKQDVIEAEKRNVRQDITPSNRPLVNTYGGGTVSPQQAVQGTTAMAEQVQAAKNAVIGIEAQMRKLSDSVSVSLFKGLEPAIKYLEGPLVRAIAQASIETSKSLVTLLPRSEKTVQMQTQLELDSIAVRKNEIVALKELSDSLNLKRIQEDKKEIDTKISTGNLDARDLKLLQGRLQELTNQELAIKGKTSYRELAKSGQLTPEVANILSQNTGFQAKLAGLSGEEQRTIIKGVADTEAAKWERKQEDLQKILDATITTNKEYLQSSEFLSKTAAEQTTEAARRAQEEQQQRNAIANIPLQKQVGIEGAVAGYAQGKLGESGMKDIAIAAAEAKARSQDLLESQTNIQKVELDITKTINDRKVAAQQYGLQIQESNLLEDSAKTAAELIVQKQLDRNELLLKQIDYAGQIGSLSEQEVADKTYIISLENANLDRAKQILDVEDQAKKSRQSLIHAQKEAGTENQRESVLALQRVEDERNAKLASIDQEFAKKKQLAEFEKFTRQENQKRIDQYNQVFMQGIDKASDAFVEFAKTGKLSFGSLVEDMLAGLLKVELKMQMMRLYNAAGGAEGFVGGVKSLLGGGSSSSNVVSYDSVIQAKGGVWEDGVMRFAQGGMFTNSVVTQPTQFKFAQGTGLMGEAGPEAIMPLKRDNNGNLGVRAGNGGGNVDVVVNNYSTEKATAKETVDSRGNRRVEVTVGDMTAGELARSGSAPQRAIKNTFGIQPQLIRR